VAAAAARNNRGEAVTLSEIEARQLRHETVRRLLKLLTANSRTPLITGHRTELFDFLINGTEDRRQRTLAKRLGVSEARVSVAVKFLREKLVELQGG
jgi:Trp operon repressor